jgi:cytochrome c
MDSMDVNKGVAAILIGGIAFFLTGLIGDSLIHERPLEKSVLNIQGTPVASSAAPQEKGPGPITALLASADPAVGEKFAKTVCVACHTFNKGGKPGVGPNLYGVVGGPHDHEEGFNYSPAMEKYKGQPWTFDALNHWLYKPSIYAPGTRMSFAGITNDKQRADVIDFLRTNADNPVPLPKPEEQPAATPAAAPAPAAPAGGAASAPAAPAKPSKP